MKGICYLFSYKKGSVLWIFLKKVKTDGIKVARLQQTFPSIEQFI